MTRTLTAPRQPARYTDDYVGLPPAPPKPHDNRPPRMFGPSQIATIGNAIYRGMRPLRLVHDSEHIGQKLALTCSGVVGELIVASRRLATDRPMAAANVDDMRRSMQKAISLIGGQVRVFCEHYRRADVPMLAAAERDLIGAIEIIIAPPTLDTH